MSELVELEDVGYECPVCGKDLIDDPEDWMEDQGKCVECVAEDRG